MLSYIKNPAIQTDFSRDPHLSYFSLTVSEKVRDFHKSLDGYAPTPLIKLESMARKLNVAEITVKDESKRFGLNAFKALGASHAVFTILSNHLGLEKKAFNFSNLKNKIQKKRESIPVLITATDGNHGRAVAWAAEKLGLKAVVYMPKGTKEARIKAIEDEGADVFVIDGNYDDAVHLAGDAAEKNGWILVQDTAEKKDDPMGIAIMQGYMTILSEVLDAPNHLPPTHVFAQCGVGSFSGSLLGYLVNRFGSERPFFTVVEPEKAACYYLSIKEEKKNPLRVTGALDTIMAGLACGEANMLSWHILSRYADCFVSLSDEFTEAGMRLFHHPLGGDPKIISGESGAVTLGLAHSILNSKSKEMDVLRKSMGINEKSRILLISTEGDTDPEMYQRIISGP